MDYYKPFLVDAYRAATYSPDPSTQNGALLIRDGKVIAAGINAFPAGVVDSLATRWERPEKYKWVEHAERNAIYSAARSGNPTWGTAMVCGWAACSDCARAIVQSGVVLLVRHKDATLRSPDHWLEEIAVADVILQEGGVQVIDVEGSLGAPTILHSGVEWTP